MQNYLMLTFSAVLLGINFALSKLYQVKEGSTLSATAKFNAYSGLFTILVFWILNGFKINFTAYSLIMAALTACFGLLYTLLGFKLLALDSMALYTLFLMTGGMILPYIWGLVFLDEPFSALRTVGLCLILTGVIVSNFSGEKADIKKIVLCIAIFILNGFISVISKLHQIETVHSTVNSNEFIVFTGIFKYFFAQILLILNKKSHGEKNGISPGVYLIILLSAIVSGVSYLLQLLGAAVLPAGVIYPFITGGSIIFTALTGRMVFKNVLSKKMILSIILCFVGTIMFL